MWLWVFWWCVDDHIALAFNEPGIGTLPWWVPLILGVAFSTTVRLSVAKD
jgi:hypothetical protein